MIDSPYNDDRLTSSMVGYCSKISHHLPNTPAAISLHRQQYVMSSGVVAGVPSREEDNSNWTKKLHHLRNWTVLADGDQIWLPDVCGWVSNDAVSSMRHWRHSSHRTQRTDQTDTVSTVTTQTMALACDKQPTIIVWQQNIWSKLIYSHRDTANGDHAVDTVTRDWTPQTDRQMDRQTETDCCGTVLDHEALVRLLDFPDNMTDRSWVETLEVRQRLYETRRSQQLRHGSPCFSPRPCPPQSALRRLTSLTDRLHELSTVAPNSHVSHTPESREFLWFHTLSLTHSGQTCRKPNRDHCESCDLSSTLT